MSCGFEPVGEGQPWGHSGCDPVSICPGFTTALPQVVEVFRAHHHWTNGELKSFANRPSEVLLAAVEILDRERSDLTAHQMKKE